MTIISFKGKEPKISEGCFIADNSTIIGDVDWVRILLPGLALS